MRFERLADLCRGARPSRGVDLLFGYPGGTVLNLYDELYKNADRIKTVLTAPRAGRGPRGGRPTPAPPAAPALCWPPAAPVRPTLSPASPRPIWTACRWSPSPATCPPASSGGGQLPGSLHRGHHAAHHQTQLHRAPGRGSGGTQCARRSASPRAGARARCWSISPRTSRPTRANSPTSRPSSSAPSPALTSRRQRPRPPSSTKRSAPSSASAAGVRSAAGCQPLRDLLTKAGIPATHTLMAAGGAQLRRAAQPGHCSAMHGSFAANKAVAEADLVIAVGTRFSDRVALNPGALRRQSEDSADRHRPQRGRQER